MEQTKSFKWTNALYLLLILPLMFVFMACGNAATKQLNTEAKCDTSGDYATASDKAAFTEAVGTQTSFDSDGYRLTGTISMVNAGNETEYMYLNLMIKKTVTNEKVDYQAAMKMKMIDFEKMMADPTAKVEYIQAYAYYKDGKMYAEDPIEKTKYYEEIDFSELFDAESLSMVSCTNLEDLLGFVGAAEDVTVTKQGDNFKIVANSALTPEPGVQINAEATAYLNFKDGKVTAAQLNYVMNTGIMGTMKCSFTMSGFNGNIAFPNFSGYTQAPDDAQLK